MNVTPILVSMVEDAKSLESVTTPVTVLQDSRVVIANWTSTTVPTNLVEMEECASTK